jgi:hypothetical protein
MIMALGTVQIHAEKQTRNVLGQNVLLRVAIEIELGGRARLRIASVGREDFAHQLIVRLVGCE